MNTAVAKPTIQQCIQALKDEQRRQYHLTHDCFTGRRLTTPYELNDEPEVDAKTQKQQRDLDSLNAILYPTPKLGQVLSDSLAGLKLKPVNAAPIAAETLAKPSQDLLQRATHWFDQYCADGLATLLPAQSAQLSEANIAVVKRAFGHNSVLIQNVCMLSAFWLRSPLDWKAKDGGLFEYLFTQYEAPAFLKACWSQTVDEDSVRWLLCYVMYAQGGSLKALAKHFNWTPQSKKLWHQLFSCPPHLSPQHAVLYAEFKRLGGWDEDFTCLMANASYVIDLLEPVSEEGRDFWYDTCRWTISHQFELNAEENRKVLWWARHQFTEQARHGEAYRLQSRSLAKVRESIAEYERAQREIQRARARMAERARQVSMARNEERERMRREYLEQQEARQQQYDYDYDDVPIDTSWKNRGWDWATTAHGKKWRFVELTTTRDLYDEGEAMEHCVGGYSMSCLDGYAAIFSLRGEGYRKATIEVDPMSKQLTQMQGKCNAELKNSIQSVVEAWMQRVVKR